ncbi:hypothetical protein IHE61_25500 [Streptomyces sp. GKU 257-1]|nr:hypothetical protein [Streptomyces sp. GKU 257-1]
MDKQAAAVRGVLKDVATVGLGEVPFASKAGEYLWKGAQFAIGKLGLDPWAQGDNPKRKRVTQEYQNFDRMQRFRMTKYLYESGYPVQPPPPEEVVNSDGSLKSFDQLRQEAQREGGKDPGAAFQRKLRTLTDWTDSTAGQDGDRFDHKVDDAAEAAGGTIGGATPPPGRPQLSVPRPSPRPAVSRPGRPTPPGRRPARPRPAPRCRRRSAPAR